MSRPRVQTDCKNSQNRKEKFEDTQFRYDLYLDHYPPVIDLDPGFSEKMRKDDLARCRNSKRYFKEALKEKHETEERLQMLNISLRKRLFGGRNP